MSKPESKVKGPVGRPKKSPSIPYSQFRGIIEPNAKDAPKNCAVIWTYSEISHFQKIMKTFKSCDVQFIYLYFLKREVVIKGTTNPYSKSTKQSRLIKLTVDPNDTCLYYTRTPQLFKIAMTEWENPLQDMDESCNKFTITYRGGDHFSVDVSNASIGCSISTPVTVELLNGDELSKYDETISNALSRCTAKIINIKSGNMKSLLGKTTRKNCQKSIFKLQGQICQIDFEFVTDKHQVISFDVHTETAARNLIKAALESKTASKDKFYVINSSNEFCDISFPTIEIHKFLLHLKADMMEIYFAPGCVVARATKALVRPRKDSNEENEGFHSSFIYYVPLESSI